MNRDSFARVKVTERSSKYIFKVGDCDVDGYTIVDDGKLCNEDYIIFKNKEQMYEFQEDNEMAKYKPLLYNCDDCDYHTDRKSSYDNHIETDYCREIRGLEPLLDSEKLKYGKVSTGYYCKSCNYTPKTKTNKTSMRNHSKGKKHIKNCEKAGVAVDYCLIPVDK